MCYDSHMVLQIDFAAMRSEVDQNKGDGMSESDVNALAGLLVLIHLSGVQVERCIALAGRLSDGQFKTDLQSVLQGTQPSGD